MSDKIIFEGKLEFILQWDLDHHEPVLHLNGECLAHLLRESLGIDYDNWHAEDIDFGEFVVTFEKRQDER